MALWSDGGSRPSILWWLGDLSAVFAANQIESERLNLNA